MNIISADTEEHYNIDWTKGTVRVVENSSFRIIMVVDEKEEEVIIISVKAV
jgi:hypothetical protein